MTIYKDNGSEVSDSGSSKILEVANESDRNDVKLKEAEKTIANKDVIIKMLQDQVKKMEESYKQNVKQGEEFRYKYCLAAEKIKQMKSCPNKSKMKPCKIEQRLSKCEACSFPVDAANCKDEFLKNHYIMLQALVDEILRKKKEIESNLPCDNENQVNQGETGIKCCVGTKISELQAEINRLKNENWKLQEQIESVKDTTSIKRKINELEAEKLVRSSLEQQYQNHFEAETKKYSFQSRQEKRSALLLLPNVNAEDVFYDNNKDKHVELIRKERTEENGKSISHRSSLVDAVDSLICNQKRLSQSTARKSVDSYTISDQTQRKSYNKEDSQIRGVSFHAIPIAIPTKVSSHEGGDSQNTSNITQQEVLMGEQNLGLMTPKNDPVEATPRPVNKHKKCPRVGKTCGVQVASGVEEVKEIIATLVQKQEDTFKELIEVKNQIESTRVCTEKCNDEILNLKETVEVQRVTFMDNLQESKSMTTNNDKLSAELKEIRSKINVLFEMVEELKEKQRCVCQKEKPPAEPTVNEQQESDEDECADPCECEERLPVLQEESSEHDMILEAIEETNEKEKSEIEDTTNEPTEEEEESPEENIKKTCESCTEAQTCTGDICVLEGKYSELNKQEIQKDQQIKCLNDLINYYNRLNEEMLSLCPALPPADNAQPGQSNRGSDCNDMCPNKPTINQNVCPNYERPSSSSCRRVSARVCPSDSARVCLVDTTPTCMTQICIETQTNVNNEGPREGPRPSNASKQLDGTSEGARDGPRPSNASKQLEGARDSPRQSNASKQLEGARDGPRPSNASKQLEGARDSPRQSNASKQLEGARDGPRPSNASKELEGARDGPRQSNASKQLEGARDGPRQSNASKQLEGARDSPRSSNTSKQSGTYEGGRDGRRPSNASKQVNDTYEVARDVPRPSNASKQVDVTYKEAIDGTRPSNASNKQVDDTQKNGKAVKQPSTSKCKRLNECPRCIAIQKSQEIPVEEKPTTSRNIDTSNNFKGALPCFNALLDKDLPEDRVIKKLSIEDIYQAVCCSRRRKKDNDCTSSVSSNSVGNCLLKCESCTCNGAVQFSLEAYVNYLHEQLQVISAIENQIENLRDDIKFPQ